MSAETYPLAWPAGWPTTPASLSRLRLSSQPPLTREQIQRLPAGMIVFRRFMENPWRLYQIVEPATKWRSPECRIWEPETGWSEGTQQLGAEIEVRYPKLPRLSVKLTEAAVRERRKTVTRRLKTPTWCKPGALALVVDRVRSAGAIGLAVAEIVDVSHEWLWQISGEDVQREGFTEADGLLPADFCYLFCKNYGCAVDTQVTRIEWRYL